MDIFGDANANRSFDALTEESGKAVLMLRCTL